MTFDCTTCVYDAPSLPDLIEGSGWTWKAYEEDLRSPCFLGDDSANYAMKHDPFVYFKAIRTDTARCKRSVVPLGQIYADLADGNLPNYSFITPNMCNDAHDCGLAVADDWFKALMLTLFPALDAQAKPYLVVITWDEGQGVHSCCGQGQAAWRRSSCHRRPGVVFPTLHPTVTTPSSRPFRSHGAWLISAMRPTLPPH